jgi:hypothetical protein
MERAKVELHSVWDDCLVQELASNRDPQALVKDLVGGITTYRGRPETGPTNNQPWITWGDESHALAVSVTFDDLQEGADFENAYIEGMVMRSMWCSINCLLPASGSRSCWIGILLNRSDMTSVRRPAFLIHRRLATTSIQSRDLESPVALAASAIESTSRGGVTICSEVSGAILSVI